MGKKRRVGTTEVTDKVRLELRFDQDVFDGIKGLCDKAQISVNQLMQGLARWAIANAKQGDPDVSEHGVVEQQKPGEEQPGAIWFGRVAQYRMMTKSEAEAEEEECGAPPGTFLGQRTIDTKGQVFFRLDFTERRVVRDD